MGFNHVRTQPINGGNMKCQRCNIETLTIVGAKKNGETVLACKDCKKIIDGFEEYRLKKLEEESIDNTGCA